MSDSGEDRGLPTAPVNPAGRQSLLRSQSEPRGATVALRSQRVNPAGQQPLCEARVTTPRGNSSFAKPERDPRGATAALPPAGQQPLCEAHPAGHVHAAVRGLIIIYHEHTHEERPAGRNCTAVRGLFLYMTRLSLAHTVSASVPPPSFFFGTTRPALIALPADNFVLDTPSWGTRLESYSRRRRSRSASHNITVYFRRIVVLCLLRRRRSEPNVKHLVFPRTNGLSVGGLEDLQMAEDEPTSVRFCPIHQPISHRAADQRLVSY